EGMLLHTLSFPGSEVGFEQTVLTLRGEIAPAALRGAWERLAERHAVPRAAAPWSEVDLGALPPAAIESELSELLAADRRRGFDLERAPAMRFLLVRIGPAERRLVWSRHHLLLDGWSTAVV